MFVEMKCIVEPCLVRRSADLVFGCHCQDLKLILLTRYYLLSTDSAASSSGSDSMGSSRGSGSTDAVGVKRGTKRLTPCAGAAKEMSLLAKRLKV
jgi:hypothetical protein